MTNMVMPEDYGPGPFTLEYMQPDVIADTIGGQSLARLLVALPSSEVASRVFEQTADPADARAVVGSSVFLSCMTEALDAERATDLDPSLNAYRLGVCVAAATIEEAAHRHGSYGVNAFAEEIHENAQKVNKSGATDVAAEDRLVVVRAAHLLADNAARQRLAEQIMSKLTARVNDYSLTEVAQRAQYHLRRMGPAEGNDASLFYNPWVTEITFAYDDEGAIADITGRSPFARAMHALVIDQNETGTLDTEGELYVQGLERTLAFVAMGAAALADQEASPTAQG